jgi:hypothetical protein
VGIEAPAATLARITGGNCRALLPLASSIRSPRWARVRVRVRVRIS